MTTIRYRFSRLGTRPVVPATLCALSLAMLVACGGDSGGGAQNASGGDADMTAATGTEAPAPAELSIDPALLPEGVTVEMVQQGRDLFVGGGICFTCHTVEATGGPLAPDLTDDIWINVDGEYSSIVELVKTGVAQPIEHPGAMLPRAGLPLTDEQVEAVAAYTYMLSRM